MPETQTKSALGFETTGPVRKFLFLAVGLTRRCPPQKPGEAPLEEPDGARTSRRNIIALSGVLVLAGLAGADPGDLNVFGIEPGKGARGAIVVGAATIAVQFYWYYLRYCHLRHDAKVVDRPGTTEETLVPVQMIGGTSFLHKSANLFSNWIAFLLTIISWYFIGNWVVNA